MFVFAWVWECIFVSVRACGSGLRLNLRPPTTVEACLTPSHLLVHWSALAEPTGLSLQPPMAFARWLLDEPGWPVGISSALFFSTRGEWPGRWKCPRDNFSLKLLPGQCYRGRTLVVVEPQQLSRWGKINRKGMYVMVLSHPGQWSPTFVATRTGLCLTIFSRTGL